MKKIILSFAATALFAIAADAQRGFGIQVGGNMANIKAEETTSGTSNSLNTDSKFGVLAGFVAESPIGEYFSFRPELNFIQKGAKATFDETSGGFNYKGTNDLSMNFIEVPLNLIYNAEAGTGKIFFGAGPSIGFGLSGKYKSSVTYSGPGIPTSTDTENGKIVFDGKKEDDLAPTDMDTHYKRLDFGANVLAGYKMANGMFINVGYTMGFSNLDPNPNSSFKTKGLTFKLGYMFANKGSSE